jgi:DNA-binding PadR family transcriptional regulator
VLLNQGTIYASLVRLQDRGWITAEWGASDANRKAKFYTITKRGMKQLAEEAEHWRGSPTSWAASSPPPGRQSRD